MNIRNAKGRARMPAVPWGRNPKRKP